MADFQPTCSRAEILLSSCSLTFRQTKWRHKSKKLQFGVKMFLRVKDRDVWDGNSQTGFGERSLYGMGRWMSRKQQKRKLQWSKWELTGKEPWTFFVMWWKNTAGTSLGKKKRERLGNHWVLWQNERGVQPDTRRRDDVVITAERLPTGENGRWKNRG